MNGITTNSVVTLSSDSSGYCSSVLTDTSSETFPNRAAWLGQGSPQNSLHQTDNAATYCQPVVVSCYECGRMPTQSHEFLKCSGCYTVHYCSKEHQRASWKQHKARCKAIQAQLLNKPPMEAIASSGTIEDLPIGASAAAPRSEGITMPTESDPDAMDLSNSGQESGYMSSGSAGGQAGDGSSFTGDRSAQSHSSPMFFVEDEDDQDMEERVANLYLSHEGPKFIDHSRNIPYSVSLEQHLQACADASARKAKHISKYQAFCLRVQQMSKFAVQSLEQYGWCVIDNFLGHNHCSTIQHEVEMLYSRGLFDDGRLMKTVEGNLPKDIRSDKIYWFDNRDKQAADAVTISFLISMTDSITVQLNGRIPPYNVNGRSRAMVACYPGNGTKYVKHVDNPKKDGRCLTTIYYVNPDWKPEDGGVLRLTPETAIAPVDIEPIFDRLLIFFSDKRNPHEVTPAYKNRFAITIWYFDAKEKAEAMARGKAENDKDNDSESANALKSSDPAATRFGSVQGPPSVQHHPKSHSHRYFFNRPRPSVEKDPSSSGVPGLIIPDSSTADLSHAVIPDNISGLGGGLWPDSDSGLGF